MDIFVNGVGVALGFMALAYVGLYLFVFFYLRKRFRARRAIAVAIRGVASVLQADETGGYDVADQIRILYDQLSKEYGDYFSEQYSSPTSMLHKILHMYDTSQSDDGGNASAASTRQLAALEVLAGIDGVRDKMFCALRLLNEKEPFAGLSGKRASLFQHLVGAIDQANHELAVTTLGQLSQEVEALEEQLASEERDAGRASVVSIVGVILTLVFGGFSLLQIFLARGA